MAYITAYNTTDTVLVVDEDGRTIDGHGWGTVDTTSELVKGATEAGWLELYRDLDAGPGQNPAATEAIEETKATVARAEVYSELEADHLRRIATDAGYEGEETSKSGLVAYLSHRGDLDAEASAQAARELLEAEAAETEKAKPKAGGRRRSSSTEEA